MTAPARSYPTVREYIERRTEISPRVRRAILLHRSGAVPTKKAAAEAAGITPQYLTLVTNLNPVVKQFIEDLDAKIADGSVSETVLLQQMAREALVTSRQLMHNGKDEVRARVAADILDRNAATQKTQKVQVDTFSLSNDDAKELARALVKAAEAKIRYPEAAELIEVDIDRKVTDGGPGPS